MGLLNMQRLRTSLQNKIPMNVFACAALCCALGTAHAEQAAPNVTERHLSIAGFIDAGQVMHGVYVNDDGGTPPLELHNTFMNRDGVAITYSAILNEKLHMTIGVGGLFWKPFLVKLGNAATEKINFGPGISEASSQYDFTPNLTFKFGYFGYKYNPDATNLGEYLLRSEAYPTVLQNGQSGGWDLIGNAYKSMGTKLTWDLAGGNFRQDLLIFSDFYSNPLFDISPSYVATWKVGKVFELGGGLSLHRWIPIKPSQTTPTGADNTYAEIPGFPAYPGFAGGTLKTMESLVNGISDSAGNPLASRGVDAQGRTVFVTSAGDTLRPSKETELTFKAIEVMGRASLNLGAAFGMEEGSTGPFKLFGELAVLGIQNQPYYYEDVTQRMPMMFGVDIPTFKLFDLLSVQAEYFKNDYPDNNFLQFQNGWPQPTLPGEDPVKYAAAKQAGVYKKDDWKWSVMVQRTIIPGWQAYLQVANDHLRTQDESAQPSFMPVTQGKSDWYYLIRFLWSI